MNLINLVCEENILVPMKSTTKTEAVIELIDVLKNNGKIADSQTVLEAVLARESLSTTGLSNGVAVPHGKSEALKSLELVIGVSPTGIDFDSIDKMPSKLFFLMLAPMGQGGQHIEALAEIAKLAQSSVLLRMLKSATSAKEVISILSD